MTIQQTVIMGMVVLLLLCWNDFREKIVRPKSPARYYAAMGFFFLVNIAVYVLVLRVVIDADPVKILRSPAGSPLSNLQVFQPLVVSMMYFGAGAATFKFGKIEFNFYQKIIQIFQSMFSVKWGDIERQLDRAQLAYDTLKEKVERLQESSDARWGGPAAEALKSMRQELEATEGQVHALADIRSHLAKEPVSRADIERVVQNITARAEKLRACAVKKLRGNLILLIRHARNEADIEGLLDGLIQEPDPAPCPRQALLYRSLVLSFLFGMLFGPIFAISNDLDPVRYGWSGALSLSAFGAVMSRMRRLEGKPLAALNAAVVGAVAGAAGYLVWGMLISSEPFADYGKRLLADSLIGIQFGVGVALVLHLLKYTLLSRMRLAWMQYGSTGLLGSAVFVLLAAGNFPAGDLSYAATGLIGMVVMLAMAFSLDLLPARKPAP